MKAAIVISPGTKPTFGEFRSPVWRQGLEIITVTAVALTNLTKGRAAGSHYSADNDYPFVPGVDGVGTLADGRRVYFAMPEAPFGAMAEQTLVDPRRTITLPDNLDDVAATALANPGMSCFAALIERARFQAGETVLINGATGSAGAVAVQVAKQLGAGKVIVTGRNAQELETLRALGADVVIPFDLRPENSQGTLCFFCPSKRRSVSVPTSWIIRGRFRDRGARGKGHFAADADGREQQSYVAENSR